MEGKSDGEGALEGIQARLSLFPEAERKIARCVLLEPKKALHSNVRELAARSGVSQAAVIRFCKRIGFLTCGMAIPPPIAVVPSASRAKRTWSRKSGST